MKSKLNLAEEIRRTTKFFIRNGSINIVNFINHYTSIIASSCPPGTDVHIYSPVIENVKHIGFEDWCISNGYHYHPVNIELEKASEIALAYTQLSLSSVIKHMVSRELRYWVAVPEEIRLVKSDEGWNFINYEPPIYPWNQGIHPSRYLMLNPRLALAYLTDDNIQALVSGERPGKLSNRSTDRSIWKEFDTTVIPYDFQLALRPLWDHYSGKVMFGSIPTKNKNLICSYQEKIRMLEEEMSYV